MDNKTMEHRAIELGSVGLCSLLECVASLMNDDSELAGLTAMVFVADFYPGACGEMFTQLPRRSIDRAGYILGIVQEFLEDNAPGLESWLDADIINMAMFAQGVDFFLSAFELLKEMGFLLFDEKEEDSLDS